jgi:hypothetical protein
MTRHDPPDARLIDHMVLHTCSEPDTTANTLRIGNMIALTPDDGTTSLGAYATPPCDDTTPTGDNTTPPGDDTTSPGVGTTSAGAGSTSPSEDRLNDGKSNSQSALYRLTDFMKNLVRYSVTNGGEDIEKVDVGSMSFREGNEDIILHFTYITSILDNTQLEMARKSGNDDAESLFECYTEKDYTDVSKFIGQCDLLAEKFAWVAKQGRDAGFITIKTGDDTTAIEGRQLKKRCLTLCE